MMPSTGAFGPPKMDLPELVQPFHLLIWLCSTLYSRIVLDGDYDSVFCQPYAVEELLPHLDPQQAYPLLQTLQADGWLTLEGTDLRLTRKIYFWYLDTRRSELSW